jgi:tRNA/tmRNA/rRNA uracil-C5-methylase (TrmA/RlmC/RlmD family)
MMAESPLAAMTLDNRTFRALVLAQTRAGAAAEPLCRHAPPHDWCGGCTLQDRAYAAQVAGKHAALRQLWRGHVADDVIAAMRYIASPEPFGYRARMDFVASKARFGLRRAGRFNYIVDLHECHLISPRAFAAARHAYDLACTLGWPDYHLREHHGFLRYIVVRRSPDDELLIACVTSDPAASAIGGDQLERWASQVLQAPGVVGVHWLRNDTRNDSSFGIPTMHWGAATLGMRVGSHRLHIAANSFFQNNLTLLEPLLDHIGTATAGAPRVADVYGGVGTIALTLADRCDQIVSIESVAESTRLAEYNRDCLGADRCRIIGSDALVWLQAQPAASLDVLIVDPPRTGLGPQVCAEIRRIAPERVIYLSCHPLTQRDDWMALAADYTMHSLTGYDMFPQTPHIETLAILDRRGATQPSAAR